MNEITGHWELRYNIVTADNCDHQYHDDLGALLQASVGMVNPWEIRRVSDGLLVYAETETLCDCGVTYTMRGWRVCASCAEVRLINPEMWAELEPRPDELPDGEKVPLEFLLWDMTHLHVGQPS